jgi:hypothetical protein
MDRKIGEGILVGQNEKEKNRERYFWMLKIGNLI